MDDFSIADSNLHGTHYIGASAGTGKTYVLSHLFLRLLLEQQRSAEEIVVVTFTEAATQELRSRIRQLLKRSLELLNDAPAHAADATLASIIQRAVALHGVRRCKAGIFLALQTFDSASIYTIHGFCGKILHDFTVETHGLFSTTLITDTAPLLYETVVDFWRITFAGESPYFSRYVLERNVSPASLLGYAQRYGFDPELVRIPAPCDVDIAPAEAAYEQAVLRMTRLWEKENTAIADILHADKGLDRNKYRPASVGKLLQAMERFVYLDYRYPVLPVPCKKLAQSVIDASVKKGCPPPQHPFFGLVDGLAVCGGAFTALLGQKLLHFKHRCLSLVPSQFTDRNLKSQVCTFDDLVLSVYHILKASSGDRLCAAVRSRYTAALIDEYQDTDTLQTFIFSRLFWDDATPLLLIGDPKQSIYGFRNADIHSVLASQNRIPATHSHTLTVNYRSTRGLLDALNAVFGNRQNPFVNDAISYAKVRPPAGTETAPFISLAGAGCAPFHLWFFPAAVREPGGSKPWSIPKETASVMICKEVGRRVAALCTRGLFHAAPGTSRPVRPSDIAILVRRNREAQEMKRMLNALGIPGVLHHTENIFDSDEALDLFYLLHAVASPGNRGYALAASLTVYFGYTAQRIYDLRQNEASFESYREELCQYRSLWESGGLLTMLAALMNRNGTLARVLSTPDGERAASTMMHLHEILQKRYGRHHWSQQHLLPWFAKKITGNMQGVREEALRLEHDDPAVRIITIHASKGLEYPIVFCPFSWGSSERYSDRDDVVFHDHGRRTLDLGSGELQAHAAAMEMELLAENIRLLYVGLTRAQQQCYCVWGSFKDAQTSALAYLLHTHGTPSIASLEDLKRRCMQLDDDAMIRDCTAFAESSQHSVAVTVFDRESVEADIHDIYQESAIDGASLVYRTCTAALSAPPRLASFSSLHRESASLLGDGRDAMPGLLFASEADVAGMREGPVPGDIFSFPRGPDAGQLLHDLFEECDFRNKDEAYARVLVEGLLPAYGFGMEWAPVCITLLSRVRTMRLSGGGAPFTLGDVAPEHMVREMEFYYPLQPLTAQKLTTALQRLSVPGISAPVPMPSLHCGPVEGFMHGFIDLFFEHNGCSYIIDWKSNHLGAAEEAYTFEHLYRCMAVNHYLLQASLYCLAADRTLAYRKKDYRYSRHFGGIYYIFLRGITDDPSGTNGIFFFKPEKEYIEHLADTLLKPE